MANFLSNMISLGIEGILAYSSTKNKAKNNKNILERLISGDEEVPIDEFLSMYDLRIYNFDSKRDDIKFMKNFDFEGVYIIHNCSRNIYHVGRSKKVLIKIDRTFRGYENQAIYDDWKKEHEFKVKIVKFDSNAFDDITLLEKELRKKYGVYL